MATKPKLPQKPLHRVTLRKLFNHLGFEDGSSTIKVLRSDPVRVGHHQPQGTSSQIVSYYHGKDSAVCHRYVLPDGTLGASKKPDPKMIRHAGTEFVTHGDKCQCKTCGAPPDDWKIFV